MVLETILNLWDLLSDGLQSVYGILTTTLRELMNVDIPIVQTVVDFILNNLGEIADWTVLDVMFGIGIPFIIVFSITKWFLDIVL